MLSGIDAHLLGPCAGIQLVQLGQNQLGQRHQRPQRIVEVVSHPARQSAQGLQPPAGCHAFPFIALVQTRPLQQFLVNLDTPQRHIELVAQYLVAVGFGQTLEHGNPQTLGFEHQRKRQQGASARLRVAARWK